MSYLFLEKYYKNLKKKLNYNINNIIVLNLILGNLNKKGKKSLSYFFLINILFLLKKENKKQPFLELNLRINYIKPSILLYNKRRGTIIFELPRFLTIEQSTRKGIEWLIKITKKRKKKMLDNLLIELKNIVMKKGEVLKKKENIILIAEKNKPFFYLLK